MFKLLTGQYLRNLQAKLILATKNKNGNKIKIRLIQ